MNIEDIRRLTELLRDTPEVGSIEVRGWFGSAIVVTRNGRGPSASLPPVVVSPAIHAGPGPAPGVGASAAGTPSPRSAEPGPAAPALKEVKSPMVGTFYKAPEPGADPYVKVGTRITLGQTVCIIEAMKIMNEIEAEVSGVVREVCADDAQPVEFGQVLFRVDPNG